MDMISVKLKIVKNLAQPKSCTVSFVDPVKTYDSLPREGLCCKRKPGELCEGGAGDV